MTVVGRDRVVVAGGVVVLTSRKASSGTWDGTSYEAVEWISEVYVPAEGTWRCAFSQKTTASAG